MARKRDDTAGVIFPPPLIYAGFFAAGLLADRELKLVELAPEPRHALGALVVAAGFALGGLGVLAMRRAATRISPYEPTTALATRGVYRLTRNPLYLALTLVYAGAAIAAAAPIALLLLVPALMIMRWGVIAREERYLAAKFGQPYLDYCARVRRWL